MSKISPYLQCLKKLFSITIPNNRNFGLDLLRFIAILTVLISHSITVLPPKYYIVHKFIFDGVLVFFVLSGFLIGRILIRDFEYGVNKKKLIHFWKRRWFRTLPAYYFTILIIIVLYLLIGADLPKKAILKCFFFVQNIHYRSGAFFTESWSLSIEEWFYLLIPLLIFLLNKTLKLNIKTNIVLVFFLVLFFSISIRTFIHHNTIFQSVQEWDMGLRSPVITRLDSILMGVLGAWFFIYKKEWFYHNKNLMFWIGITIFIMNKIYTSYIMDGYNNFYFNVIYFSLIPFSILLTIPAIYYMKPPSWIILKNTISIGSIISYSMYLINLTIVSSIILSPLTINYWIKFILFWTLTIMGSILMYKYIETPFMKLRDRKKTSS